MGSTWEHDATTESIVVHTQPPCIWQWVRQRPPSAAHLRHLDLA